MKRNSDEYCATGCQSAFGSCGSSASASPSPQPSATPQPQTSGPAVSGNSLAPNKEGCVWVVDGAGSFTQSQIFDFSTLTSVPTEGLAISPDHISSSPYTQVYTPSNVAVGSGSLQLRVPGGQTASPILGAEVYTQDKDILYGSVRTTMKASTVAGTCHGAFFYKNDNQEVDIEIITGGAVEGVHYTNQKASDDATPSTIKNNLQSDATTGFLEYRIDWVPGRTDFYLDGTLQTSLTENVPSTAGTWLWNNWRSVIEFLHHLSHFRIFFPFKTTLGSELTPLVPQ
ncbi:MAG: hypothetical protein ALECFALPRED_004357 [Alectoria fallacina]|uniref:GH16 domain-containing protein n=1 Tax=Alectoria fallacina TaxID=1903189 RepID=A0A8H3EN06_9LECA|nr:MAG: hypothetical protein ALECFALPRED_004357 [Alectoria fallacina]